MFLPSCNILARCQWGWRHVVTWQWCLKGSLQCDDEHSTVQFKVVPKVLQPALTTWAIPCNSLVCPIYNYLQVWNELYLSAYSLLSFERIQVRGIIATLKRHKNSFASISERKDAVVRGLKLLFRHLPLAMCRFLIHKGSSTSTVTSTYLMAESFCSSLQYGFFRPRWYVWEYCRKIYRWWDYSVQCVVEVMNCCQTILVDKLVL